MWKLFLILAATFLQAASPDLQELWQQEIQSELSISGQLKNQHVLWVGGVLNEFTELLSGYFADNREAVEEDLGGETSYFGPSSRNSIPKNAEILNELILKTYFERGKPLILVGHSKGAAEILHVILEHPDLILTGIVEQVILIQAAIQGSPIANDPSRWSCPEIVKGWMGLNTGTLSEAGAKTVFDAAFKRYYTQIEDGEHELISKRIFYVRSAQSASDHSYCMQLILEIVQHNEENHPVSDGILPVHAQMDARIGIDLGIVHADHLSLVISWIGSFSKQERKAFTRAVFKLIFLKYT